jgi:hypothetical protein
MDTKYKIIDVMNNNCTTPIFKINIGNKYYALTRYKLQKSEILEYKDIFRNNKILENTDSNHILNRIIYFNQFMNTINKNHFPKLYKYKINKCIFTQQLKDKLTKYNELIISKYCLDVITDLQDGTLYSILYSLSAKQIYSAIIQCVYILHLIHSNGFYHRDVHGSGFLYKKTKLKTIKIFGLAIPTFGYIYSIIDYQNIISTKFQLNYDETFEMSSRDYKYEDNMNFLNYSILHGSVEAINIVNKIINKDNTLFNDKGYSNFYERKLNYVETANYCLYASDSHKLINYFYKLIKSKL